MFKKLQLKFITIVAGSTFLVILIIFLSMNYITYRVCIDEIHSKLNIVYANNGILPEPDDDVNDNYENIYKINFFVLEYYNQNLMLLNVNNVSSKNINICRKYVRDNINKENKNGHIHEFYYLKYTKEDSIRYIFVDGSSELRNVNNTKLISLFISLASWILVISITSLLSRRALKPYIRQYKTEKEFITNASHELKTPLAIIQANNELLKVENQNNEWINSNLKQTSRMSKLVNDLVLLTKLDENRKDSMKFEKFNLSELFIDACESYRVLTNKKNIDFKYAIDEDINYNGNIDSISKLCFILLDNAYKYTLENGFINVKLYIDKKNTITIIFENSCEQMTQNDINNIFQRFYRKEASRSRKTGGFGIGLSLAKSIVELHKGTIKTKLNENGCVICFIIKLN